LHSVVNGSPPHQHLRR